MWAQNRWSRKPQSLEPPDIVVKNAARKEWERPKHASSGEFLYETRKQVLESQLVWASLDEEGENWPNIDWQEKIQGDFTGPQKYF